MSEKKIADALGLRSLEEVREESKSELPEIFYESGEILDPENESSEERNSETIESIEFARGNVKSVIQVGSKAMTNLMDLASQSDAPRAYEVLATIMKTLVDANKDYVELSMKKKFEKEDAPEKASTNVVNNNLVISTADLLRLMKGENNDK